VYAPRAAPVPVHSHAFVAAVGSPSPIHVSALIAPVMAVSSELLSIVANSPPIPEQAETAPAQVVLSVET